MGNALDPRAALVGMALSQIEELIDLITPTNTPALVMTAILRGIALALYEPEYAAAIMRAVADDQIAAGFPPGDREEAGRIVAEFPLEVAG